MDNNLANNKFTVESKEYNNALKKADGLLCFSGGEGGSVQFEGAGTGLVKRCAPIDRIVYINLKAGRSKNVALKITAGLMDHITGEAGSAISQKDMSEFFLDENKSDESINIRGAVPALDISPGTMIFNSALGTAYTQIQKVDEFGLIHIPHWGANYEVNVAEKILDYFGVSIAPDKMATHGWEKTSKPEFQDDPSEGFYTYQGVATIQIPVVANFS